MRDDLLALTPEVLAAQSNAGLLRRAQKENAEGLTPQLTESADGTVCARFPDGVLVRLPPGCALGKTDCSCGAKSVCRHRLSAVLAYRQQAGGGVRPVFDVSNAELAAYLSRSTLPSTPTPTLGAPLAPNQTAAHGQAEWAHGSEIELSVTPPTARFAVCTVRFLAGADLAHAVCDCGSARCLHVAWAVQAFWSIPDSERAKNHHVRPLGSPAQVAQAPTLDSFTGLLSDFLLQGLADARLQKQKAVATSLAGYPWLTSLLDELFEQQEAFANRSALHDRSQVQRLLAEGFARAKAAVSGKNLGPILGASEPLSLPLPQVRLLSLGARLSAIGPNRFAEVLFWDGTQVLSFSLPIPAGTEPASFSVIAGVPLAQFATGQVLSRHLTRRARRTIEIRRGRETSCLPHSGNFGELPPPVFFPTLEGLFSDENSRPPWFLRARTKTQTLRVVATPGGITDWTYSRARQQLRGTYHEGPNVLRLHRCYEWFAPGALSNLCEHMPAARFVTGFLHSVGGEKVLEPIAVVTDHVLLPDLAADNPVPNLPPFSETPESPLSALLSRVETALQMSAHEGLFACSWPDLEAPLAAVGLQTLADCFGRLLSACQARQTEQAVAAWADTAIWVALANHVLSRKPD